MGTPKTFHTGNATTDRQNRELAEAQKTWVESVDVESDTAIIKTIKHRLGRKPKGWRVARRQPADGVTDSVAEVTDGKWSRDEVELEFGGSGHWEIEFF